MRIAALLIALFILGALHGVTREAVTTEWAMAGRDAQHTGLSDVPGQPLEAIRWSTPVDRPLAGSPGALLIHYGSPVITAANTLLLPVRMNTRQEYEIEARDGSTGALKYRLPTDYTFAPFRWVPSVNTALTVRGRFYYPCAGGTVCYRDNPDAPVGSTGRIAFYGNDIYRANMDAFHAAVKLTGAILADREGNIFFAFRVLGPNPANLQSGIARISADGVGSWVSASAAALDGAITQVPLNAGASLSNDQATLYFPVNARVDGGGYLVSVNSRTLAPVARTTLKDPQFPANNATLLDDSTASPTVGPDGDVYFGVNEAACCANNARGWMLHFDASLARAKTPGAFGWDSTASIVPAALVEGYRGPSSYLILTKYNNYRGAGAGDGRNRMALLDPNATMTDPVTRATVMNETATILGATAEGPAPGVKEWCVNTVVIDRANRSALVNNEDGVLYRWDFATNTFSEKLQLTTGVFEAYTPTLIGPDGTVYAINDAVLFAAGRLREARQRRRQ